MSSDLFWLVLQGVQQGNESRASFGLKALFQGQCLTSVGGIHRWRVEDIAMKTVILCGGQGTRIRDVSDQIPKPLVPVGPLPILWHIMRYYAHYDLKDFVLCLGYKGKLIKDFFLNYDTEVSDFTIQLGAQKSVEFLRSHGQVDWRVTLA